MFEINGEIHDLHAKEMVEQCVDVRPDIPTQSVREPNTIINTREDIDWEGFEFYYCDCGAEFDTGEEAFQHFVEIGAIDDADVEATA